jgi:hypothetical protein
MNLHPAHTRPRDDATRRAATSRALHEKLREGWRMDPLSLGLRVATLVLAYALLARAIARHDLPLPLVVLPIAAEILAVMWIGVLLARCFIACPVFREGAHGLFAPLLWSVLIGGAYLAWLAFDPVAGELVPARMPGALVAAAQVAVASGVHWAVLAVVGGIAVGSALELRRWRTRGGVFVWGQTIGGGMRIVLAIFGAPLLVLAFALLGPFALEAFPALLDVAPAWWAFGLMALAELAVLGLAFAMHRYFAAHPHGPPARYS